MKPNLSNASPDPILIIRTLCCLLNKQIAAVFHLRGVLFSECQRIRERGIRERSLLPWWKNCGIWMGLWSRPREVFTDKVMFGLHLEWWEGIPNLFDWGCRRREDKPKQKGTFAPHYRYPKGHSIFCMQKVVCMRGVVPGRGQKG